MNKKKLIALAGTFVVLGGMGMPLHAATIAAWDFNNAPPSTTVNTSHILATTNLGDFFFSSGMNVGQAGTVAVSGTNYAANVVDSDNNGEYLVFSLSTAGFTDVSVNYDSRAANGNKGFSGTWGYSLNGSSYTALGATFTPSDSFAAGSLNLSALATSVENQSNIFFRVLLSGGANKNAAFSIDNVTFTGTGTQAPAPVPLPAAAWLLITGLGAVGAVARRRRSDGSIATV